MARTRTNLAQLSRIPTADGFYNIQVDGAGITWEPTNNNPNPGGSGNLHIVFASSGNPTSFNTTRADTDTFVGFAVTGSTTAPTDPADYVFVEDRTAAADGGTTVTANPGLAPAQTKLDSIRIGNTNFNVDPRGPLERFRTKINDADTERRFEAFDSNGLPTIIRYDIDGVTNAVEAMFDFGDDSFPDTITYTGPLVNELYTTGHSIVKRFTPRAGTTFPMTIVWEDALISALTLMITANGNLSRTMGTDAQATLTANGNLNVLTTGDYTITENGLLDEV